jgi:hypothetical protein
MTPPIPASDPRAPKYWLYETSGVLAPAIGLYLSRPRSMTDRDIALVAAYFSQWIDSPAWDANPNASEENRAKLAELRIRAGKIATVDDIHAWLGAALQEGIDPL